MLRANSDGVPKSRREVTEKIDKPTETFAKDGPRGDSHKANRDNLSFFSIFFLPRAVLALSLHKKGIVPRPQKSSAVHREEETKGGRKCKNDDNQTQKKHNGMNNNWSDEFVSVVMQSKRFARRLNVPEISSGCLLAGIFSESRLAANILEELGLNKEQGIEDLAQMEEGNRFRPDVSSTLGGVVSMGDPVLMSEGQRLLRLARLEARKLGEEKIAPEHLLLGILYDSGNPARKYLNEKGVTFQKVAEKLNIRPGVRSAFEYADEEPSSPMGGKGESPVGNAPEGQDENGTPVLDKYGVDLTQKAEKNLLDPVVGRSDEILRMAQILCRRKKNNPMLIGQPGVGKSALVEGLSQLIASRRAPHSLWNKRVIALDMAAIVAGTQFRGQFEERLRKLIVELKRHTEVILFIDEIHTIIGAGSAAGSLDAANILKPALARGEIQCIGATTINEYRKSIEKDGALERRFQKIMLEPSTAEQALEIIQNLRGRYEEHHAVKYTDEALKACVRLTNRYITERCLPDKAIDAMDEAGSLVHLANLNVPQPIRDKEKEVEMLKARKTEAAKKQDYELAAKLRDAVAEESAALERMNKEWLATVETDNIVVDVDDVARVVSMMSGIPVGSIKKDEKERLRTMKDALRSRVIAQDEAIEKLVKAITMSRLGLKGSDRPIGTFLFVGPTGVGKTHLVKCLAEYMFDSKDALIRVDMSEYGEKYSTSRLLGAPPGYVGYEEGGQLTERVRRHPYSVVLLDEIEKAHPDVFNTLLQVMDEGRLTDGNGSTIDFRNTVIIMTSNSGTRQLEEYGAGVGFNAAGASGRAAESIIQKALTRQFAPEFLNRIDEIILFKSLEETSAKEIARIELGDLAGRLEKMGHKLRIDDEMVNFIVKHGFNKRYGARSLKRAVKTYLEDPLCEALLTGQYDGSEELTFHEEGDKLVIGEKTTQLSV